jgi:hypothetical protein
MLRKSLIKIVFSCCVYNGMHLVQYYVSFVTKVNRYVYGSSLFLFHLSDLNYEQLRLCHCCLPLCETIVSRHKRTYRSKLHTYAVHGLSSDFNACRAGCKQKAELVARERGNVTTAVLRSAKPLQAGKQNIQKHKELNCTMTYAFKLYGLPS